MKIKNLHIKNIGPFKEAALEFATDFVQVTGEQPVTIITGVNGAGKSILIDAIRAALSGTLLERNIVADENDFVVEMDIDDQGKVRHLTTSQIERGHIKYADWAIANPLQYGYENTDFIYPWVIDYWASQSPSDPFRIMNMTNIKHKEVLKGVMWGEKSNVDLVNFICHVDYLRTSEVPAEQQLGALMYERLKRIVKLCLDNGGFKYVRRSDLTPIVEQNGKDLSLEKLSSGNIFLIEHLLLLMCKMYSVSVLNNLGADAIFNISGLLLIDEIETHLHPKWQKRILAIIRELFPNLQIILTTHSPFIVASIDGARIYTCVPRTGYSEVCDETEKYGHMPVEEILMSDVFGVHPFNEEITALIQQRKQLIEAGDKAKAKEIADKLYAINPEYFSYLHVAGGL